MKEKPIIFSTPNVRRILTCAKCGHISRPIPCEKCGSTEFCKTMTRRCHIKLPVSIDDGHGAACWEVAKRPQYAKPNEVCFIDMAHPIESYPWLVTLPYQVGTLGWIRETWSVEDTDGGGAQAAIAYRADGDEADAVWVDVPFEWEERVFEMPWAQWRSSRFMPKWATATWIKVTGVRVEHLQGISEEDAKAEGAKPIPKVVVPRTEHYRTMPYTEAFVRLWDSLNGKKPGFAWSDNPWVTAYTFERTEKP